MRFNFLQTTDKQEDKKDDVENAKDAVTEKSEQPAAAAVAAVEEAAAAVAAIVLDDKADTKAEEKPAENGDGAENAADTTTGTLDESKDGVENAGDDASSTPATDSAKKPKKEKSKKRFLSFRSFSFSKKDKQKPKKEEAAANTTNGECEKVPEEVSELSLHSLFRAVCACISLSIFLSSISLALYRIEREYYIMGPGKAYTQIFAQVTTYRVGKHGKMPFAWLSVARVHCLVPIVYINICPNAYDCILNTYTFI